MKCPPELYEECRKYASEDFSTLEMLVLLLFCMVAIPLILWMVHQVDKIGRGK